MDKSITVAEVTFSNSISVAEHVVMMILALVRNYIPSYGWVVKGGWNIADSVERSYDLEGMNVGTVAASAPNISSWTRASWLEPVLIPTPRAMPRKAQKQRWVSDNVFISLCRIRGASFYQWKIGRSPTALAAERDPMMRRARASAKPRQTDATG